MREVKALGFDVFGTVVDWRSSVAQQASLFLEACGLCHVSPLEFADRWRALYQPSMECCRSGRRSYVPLDVLNAETVAIVLREFGASPETITPDFCRAFTGVWHRLATWPDVLESLWRLKSRYIIVPISNGSIAMMTRLARYAGLPWDAILGADISRTYKPMPQTYLSAATTLGIEIHEMALVAAHNDDLHAARAVGLRTVFIPRPREYGPNQTSDLTPEEEWDVVERDFVALADILDC
jgi:2-haloacid dehalogenase